MNDSNKIMLFIDELRPAVPEGPLCNSIESILREPSFIKLVEMCANGWPHQSTIIASEKAIMIWLIKSIKARYVLEIGTYFAGTTFALATSVRSIGGGEVHTIDPYGTKRAPEIISSWAKSLSDLIVFSDKYSTEYLLMMNKLPAFDLIFIDGSHAYPNVLHDISASIINLKPGGYIVIDNAEQPEVIEAIRDYSKLYPSIKSILIAENGLGSDIRVEDLGTGSNRPFSCAVLQKSSIQIIGHRFTSYHLFNLTKLNLEKFNFNIEENNDSVGTINIEYHLRSIPTDSLNYKAHDLIESFSIKLNPNIFTYEIRPTLLLPNDAIGNTNFAEIGVSFTADDVDQASEMVISNFKFFVDEKEIYAGRNWSYETNHGSLIEWSGKFLGIQNACNLAYELKSNGDNELAKDLWQKIVLHAPDHGEAHYQLGLTLNKINPKLALEHFRCAHNLDPNSANYKLALDRLV
jgi:predicted O-methyltransferase YrrM